MLDRLRMMDRNFRVFGSAHHGYNVRRVLSESKLAAFESANDIRLPEDYRRFLAEVGNGGAGPFYGLDPLGTFGRDLYEPFPFVAATESMSDDELNKVLERDNSPSGVLEFCHQGCAIYSYLVVNGPTYGTIWDGREDFYPTGLTFGTWYRRWLERALRAIENERLVPRLRVGMSLTEVLEEVTAEWRVRPVVGHLVRFLEAADVPVQLVLDENDVVVNVRPWEFISARPS
jgi:hypothetical protein